MLSHIQRHMCVMLHIPTLSLLKVLCQCYMSCHTDSACLASIPLQEREKPGHKIEVDEEYEDAEGNVYNRKTYEDLRRQGLI